MLQKQYEYTRENTKMKPICDSYYDAFGKTKPNNQQYNPRGKLKQMTNTHTYTCDTTTRAN